VISAQLLDEGGCEGRVGLELGELVWVLEECHHAL